jgi:hypothetical protein
MPLSPLTDTTIPQTGDDLHLVIVVCSEFNGKSKDASRASYGRVRFHRSIIPCRPTRFLILFSMSRPLCYISIGGPYNFLSNGPKEGL